MLPELNPKKVCFIIVKMRELDGLADAPMGDTSNAADNGVAPCLRDPSIPPRARN